jgi:hypothetical protein
MNFLSIFALKFYFQTFMNVTMHSRGPITYWKEHYRIQQHL